MLGYVLPDKGELKVREYEIYGGYYCGICKYIGKTYGQLPRMVLSYDAAFIALILACVDPSPDEPTQEHCVAHHIKRKTIIRNRAIEYAGDLMLILAWFKLMDDAQDEGKTSAKAGLTAFRRIWRRLEKKHPCLCKSIDRNLSELNALERDCCPSIDRVAEGFAQVMEDIFRDGTTWLYGPAEAEACNAGGAGGNSSSEDHDAAGAGGCDAQAGISSNLPLLHETFAKIGYHLGKWIYLMDAVDDIEENLESGSYNPLLYRFRYQDGDHPTETPEQFRERIDETLRFNLFHYLAVIGESLESLAIQKNSGIIENIVYFGLNRRTEEVLKRVPTTRRI